MNREQQNYLDLFQEMVQNLIKNRHVYSIILFGSQGRGTSTQYSDYDILIIADFNETYFDRLYWVSNFTPQVPIDLFCYTPEEFEMMFKEYRLTIMDAMEDGIILYGENFLKPYQLRYEEYKKKGLKREKCVLIPPVF